VNPVTTTVLLTSNDNPSTLGTNVDFTAKVSLGSQRGVATTGSVQLLDGSTVLRRVFQGCPGQRHAFHDRDIQRRFAFWRQHSAPLIEVD
jgi:hypothetical protein